MRSSEDILLDEAKSEYTRQLTAWTELTHKSYSFLQLDGLVLTVIFVGIGLLESFEHVAVLLEPRQVA